MVLDALALYRPNIPIVYNSSGYESVETLRMLEGAVDIYLPGCPPRPEMLIYSILELRKQVAQNHKLTGKARRAAAQAAEAAALSATPIHEMKGLLA